MPAVTIKNPLYPIIATGRLKLHPTLPVTPALAASYDLDIGEQEFTINPGGDMKEMMSASGGLVGKYKKQRVRPTLAYKTKLQFLPPQILGYYMGTADAGGAPAPGKVFEFYGWLGLNMEDEAVFNDLGLYVHHSFLCALTIEGDLEAKGEDFAGLDLTADVLLGRARGVTTYAARPVAQA